MRDPHTCYVRPPCPGTAHKRQRPRYNTDHCLPTSPHFVRVNLLYRHTNNLMRRIISVQTRAVTGRRHTSPLAIASVHQTAQLYVDKWNTPSPPGDILCMCEPPSSFSCMDSAYAAVRVHTPFHLHLPIQPPLTQSLCSATSAPLATRGTLTTSRTKTSQNTSSMGLWM